MSEQFIARTTVPRAVLRRAGEAPVVERHTELVRIVRAAGGDPDLFATPILGRPKDDGTLNISWYTTRSGTPHRLDGLDGAMREDVALRLEEDLEVLRAHLEAPQVPDEDKAVLRQALCVAETGSIHMVGGHPLLTGWGTGTADLGSDADAAASHFDTVMGGLGLRLPIGASTGPGPGPGPEETPVPGQIPAALETEVAAAAAATLSQDAGPHAENQPVEEAPVARTGWWPVWVLAGLCFVLLLLLLLLLLAPERFAWMGPSGGASAVDEGLAARARALETALNGAVCTPEGRFVLPDGTGPGLLPVPSGPDSPSQPSAEAAR
ncbi:hypothetical protein [uncultured Limimaricola sp.]|uniref:hypothetical protein n=1 Tax=uncultured Limimaricola sp. TaxID=2211667 RepID=UPI0030F85CF6